MSIFLSQKQAREFLNISRTTILHWEEQGEIKVYKTSGGHLRYLKSDLEKLIGLEDSFGVRNGGTLCQRKRMNKRLLLREL